MKTNLRPTYSTKISVKSIENAMSALAEQSPRNSVVMLQVLLDVGRNQGDSPANIGDRVLADRDSSTIQGHLKKMAAWGWIEQVETQYQQGESPRKLVYLTTFGAELLNLN